MVENKTANDDGKGLRMGDRDAEVSDRQGDVSRGGVKFDRA